MKDGEKSLAKLFDLLEHIAASENGITSKRLSEITEIPLSTVFRMLGFLISRHYVRRDKARYYPGMAASRLGRMSIYRDPLLNCVRPEMTRLADETLETVHLAELRGTRVFYIDKVEGRRSVHMASLNGRFAPLHCTGAGKAIWAFLPARMRRQLLDEVGYSGFTERTIRDSRAMSTELALIRQRGYAVDDCEHEMGVYALAAPILDRNQYPVAGLCISGSELYLRPRRDELARQVTEAASRLSAQLAEN